MTESSRTTLTKSRDVNAKKRAIIREIRRLHVRREPLNLSAVKRKHSKLIKEVYAIWPYWGWKRALEDAGLGYAEINTELRDYVDCKICGTDMGALSYHLISQHQITPEEYREEYPGAEIVCETIRAGIAHRKQRHRRALPHWEDIWSPEYVLDRIAEFHRRKFPLNFDWAKQHGSALTDKAIRYFGSWDNALRRLGLNPAQIRLFRPTWRGYSPWRRANQAAIVTELRRRKKAGEPISIKKILPTKAGPALLQRAVRLFGSWSRALAAAGLDPFGGARSPWFTASKAEIVREIRRRNRAGESVRYGKIGRERSGQPLLKRARKLFGSWNAALRAAGIEPMGGYSQWRMASKEAIIRELRRRKRAGESLRSTAARGELHGRALRDRVTKLFGTWNAALRAADIKPFKENSPWRRASRDAILKEIRRRFRAGEPLATTKVERTRGGGVLINRAKIFFGSWAGALLAAGVDLPPGLMSPWPKADKSMILAEIRRRKRADRSILVSEIEREQWGPALLNRTRTLFRSWNTALSAAARSGMGRNSRSCYVVGAAKSLS